MKDWKVAVGKIVPWALGAIDGLLVILGVRFEWLATVTGLLVGLTQFILSRIPDKTA